MLWHWPLRRRPARAVDRCKVYRLVDGDQHIGVLRIRLFGCERADERDAQDTWTDPYCVNEIEHGTEQVAARGIDAGMGMAVAHRFPFTDHIGRPGIGHPG